MTKTMPVLSFAKLDEGMPMPHLLDIQTRAFQSLLQPDGKGAERTDIGLERVFKDVFPIQDVNGNYSLEFVKYALGESKYSVEECIERDMTYSVPLKATLQLVVMEEVGETTKTKRPKNIIEKEVYLGELPILTPLGTFVINGAERVIVSQLHRSPGVVFEESIHPNGQRLFSARIIPFRGSWVEFTIDIHDVIYVHIDKKKKFPATALLRAFGYGTNADILKLFYATKDIDITGKLEGRAQKREVLGTLLAADVPDPENKKGEPLGRVGDELTLEKFNTFRRAGISKVKVFAGYTSLDLRDEAQPTSTRERQGAHVLAFDVADPETGEVVAEGGRELSDTLKKKLLKAGVTKVEVLLPAGRSESPLIKNTLLKDPTHTEAELIANQFSVGLSRMARLIKERMSINNDPERITLDDLVNARTVSAVIQAFFGSSQLSQFMDQTNPLAELTHKRRLSALGPGGLTRERAGFEVRDVHYSQYGRMCPIETPEGPNIGLITSLSCYARVNDLGFIETPYRVVKSGKVTDEIRWLSASEEEEYAVAQANAHVTEDGGFTDELVLCRKRDDYPLLAPNPIDFMDVAPQRPLVHVGQKVKAGQIVADGAGTEHGELALGANVTVAFMPWYGHNFEDAIVLSERLVKDDVYSSIHIQELELHVRDTKRGREEITREIPNVAEESLVDLDERGIVRIGAHVKAGDILVGKITPKGETELSPEEKLLTAIFGEKAKDVKDSSLKVPPGMEGVVIDVKIFSRIEDQVVEKDRGERIGEVRRLEAEEKARISEAMFGELREMLANQEVGLALKAGTVEEFLPAGTKLTRQELADMNFADVDLKTLRVANKTVNEKVRAVLEAAQGERAKIEEKSEDQIDKILQPDELPPGVIQLVKVYLAEKRKISVGDKMAGRHGNKGIIARIVPEEDMPFLPDGTPLDIVLNPLGVPSRMNVGQILETHLGWCARILGFDAKTPVFQGAEEMEIGVLLRLAGLSWAAEALRLEVRPPELDADAVRDLARDLRRYPATNGGRPDLNRAGIGMLASRALSQETRDVYHRVMDFLKFAAKELADREVGQRRIEKEYHDARLEVDAELSKPEKGSLKGGLKELEKFLERDKPQEVLEAVGLPALAAQLGPKSETDVDAAVNELLRVAGLSPAGKAQLRDGRSGELFASDVTVGSIYMMKLSHLVDDKIHARSIGPYSLVTQQPLAGKAQFGGQRFGEMEVWALEAYGAAHTLQEILTVKSDDVNGRSRVYEAIVKGQNLPKPGIPESFNVL